MHFSGQAVDKLEHNIRAFAVHPLRSVPAQVSHPLLAISVRPCQATGPQRQSESMKRVSRTSTLLSELMLSASACKHVIYGLRDVAVSVSVLVTENSCDRDTTSQAIMLPVCPHSSFRRFVYGTHCLMNDFYVSKNICCGNYYIFE